MLEQHPERRAPVAEVVLADHRVPLRREHAREDVADDGAAEVPDVHLLGHVGGRVVDDDRLGRGRRSEAQGRRSGRLAELALEVLGLQMQVEEARPGDLDLLAHVVEAQVLEDRRGHDARRLAHALGERHGRVGLVVSVGGPANRRIRRGVLGAKSGSDGCRESAGQRENGIGHAVALKAPARRVNSPWLPFDDAGAPRRAKRRGAEPRARGSAGDARDVAGAPAAVRALAAGPGAAAAAHAALLLRADEDVHREEIIGRTAALGRVGEPGHPVLDERERLRVLAGLAPEERQREWPTSPGGTSAASVETRLGEIQLASASGEL